MSLKHTRAISKAQGLTRRANHLLRILADVADQRGRSFYRQERLADLAGASVRTIRSALAELEQSGWIEREHRQRLDGSRTSDLITVQDPAKAAKHVFNRLQPELRLFPLIDGGSSVDRSRSNRQDLPLGQPARFAAHESTTLFEDSNRSPKRRA
jgi:DNA-binding transcriptional MocR family regulator